MNRRFVFTLDLGASTGWACGLFMDGAPRPLRIKSGTKVFRGCREARLAEFMLWLDTQLAGRGLVRHVDKVLLYETPFARGRDATRSLWGMAGVAEAVATERDYACLDIQPTKIKEAFTGSGSADKAVMMAEVTRLGYTFDSDDEADALALLLTFGPKIQGGK